MSRDREVRTETNIWGTERQIIYENGERVGEVTLEQRGGFFGIGDETHRVERDLAGNEVSYSKEEERGGFLGLWNETVEVSYTPDHREIGTSRVEERGGFLGLGAHHARIGYDTDGQEVSETHWERRGDFLGIGGTRARVTRPSGAGASTRLIGSSSAGTSSGAGPSAVSNRAAGPRSGASGRTSSGPSFFALILVGLAGVALIASFEGSGQRTPDLQDEWQEHGAEASGPAPVMTTPVAAAAQELPSFDCARAASWAENEICQTPALAIADREVAALYALRMDEAAREAVPALRMEQRDWIFDRTRCVAELSQDQRANCLRAIYDRRIAELQAPTPVEPTDVSAAAMTAPTTIPAPTAAAPAFAPPRELEVHLVTPDGPSLLAAMELVSHVSGASDVAIRSAALGGTSILGVRFAGEPEDLVRALGGLGWVVETPGDRPSPRR